MELISVGRIVAADVPVLIKSTQGKVVLKLTKEAGTKPEKNDLKADSCQQGLSQCTVVILPSMNNSEPHPSTGCGSAVNPQ